MTFMLVSIALLGIISSLAIWTPDVPWNDITYLFRQNKKQYLAFSNRFRGKYLLLLGLIALCVLFVSYFIPFTLSDSVIGLFFILYLIIFRIILEVKWRQLQK